MFCCKIEFESVHNEVSGNSGVRNITKGMTNKSWELCKSWSTAMSWKWNISEISLTVLIYEYCWSYLYMNHRSQSNIDDITSKNNLLVNCKQKNYCTRRLKKKTSNTNSTTASYHSWVWEVSLWKKFLAEFWKDLV